MRSLEVLTAWLGKKYFYSFVAALELLIINVFSRYAATVRLQPPRKEIIMDLSSMVQEILRIFYSENNQISPQRILFYRDGLSESQFFDVAVNELQAIREACERIQPGYKPRITYVVVQKRHHARVFAMNVSFYYNTRLCMILICDRLAKGR